MIRYTIFVLTVLASAATAIAAIAPADRTAINPDNMTIVEKNQAWPVYGEIQVDDCAVEDCSEE